MNDTFSSDAWKKLSQMKQQKEDNCFSNLTRKMLLKQDDESEEMIQKTRQIDVANKVRKSY